MEEAMEEVVVDIETYLDNYKINADLKGYRYLADAIEYCMENITDPNPKILPYIENKYKVNKSMVSLTIKKALTDAGIYVKPMDFVRQAALFLVQRQDSR